MLRPVHDVERLVDDNAFWIAFAVAALGSALVWMRARRGRTEPGPAFVAVVAGLVGLRVADRFEVGLVVGMAILIGGEWLCRQSRFCTRVLWLLPGALVV